MERSLSTRNSRKIEDVKPQIAWSQARKSVTSQVAS
jgi:hypothetical protein